VTEAVIVAAARTPIGRARKGSLVDVDAFAWPRSPWARPSPAPGIDTADIDDIVLGESLYGGGDIARHTAVVLGLTNAPGIADNRHCASGLSALQRRRGHQVRHGLRGRGRRHAELELGAAVVDGAAGWRADDVDVAQPPRDLGRPAFDMSITVGEKHGERGGPHPPRRRRVGGLQPGAGESPRFDSGAFEEEIVPVEYVRPARGTRARSASTSTRAAA